MWDYNCDSFENGHPTKAYSPTNSISFGKGKEESFLQAQNACIAHFYTLHLTNISYYGGKSVIIPIELSVFEKMVEQSGRADYTPDAEQVRKLCEFSRTTAENATSEREWYEAIKEKALNWLVA